MEGTGKFWHRNLSRKMRTFPYLHMEKHVFIGFFFLKPGEKLVLLKMLCRHGKYIRETIPAHGHLEVLKKSSCFVTNMHIKGLSE